MAKTDQFLSKDWRRTLLRELKWANVPSELIEKVQKLSEAYGDNVRHGYRMAEAKIRKAVEAKMLKED